MALNESVLAFAKALAAGQQVWALTAGDDEWVVCDSNQFEDTEVFLLWSSEAKAKAECTGEWEIYRPEAISLEEYLDFWVEELNEDGTVLGLDWTDEGDNQEFEPVDLAKALLETGSFKEPV